MTALHILGALSFVFVVAFTWRAYRQPAGTGQSPREAIIEAWINLCIGFTLNFIANAFIIPIMSPGGHMTAAGNFWGGWIYTAVSLLRQYAIRRWANKHLTAFAKRLAG